MGMYEIAKEVLPGASVGALIAAVFGYLIKQYFERTMDRIEKDTQRREGQMDKRAEELRTTSLALKQGLRKEERDELVGYRVAVEKWEYFLQTSLFDFSIMDPAKTTIETLYEQDKKTFFEVKVAIVRATTYLRDRALEIQLMAAVTEIRKLYYPLINETLPNLIDIRTNLMPVQDKLTRFAASGMKDMTYAPTPQDQQNHLALQEQLTAGMRQFSERITAAYPVIAGRMVDMKEAINFYIYRPVTEAAVDRD